MTEPAGPMPEPLVNILTRRRIAIGRDSRGRVVVARPDSVLVRVGDSAERRDNIASWVANEALDGVTGIRDTLSADGHHVELNHVALGVPSVATLLGAPAMQVGDVVFTGQAMKNAAGEAVLRTSAEPAIAPRFLRGPLRMAGRRAPRVLMMDSGLRIVDGAGNTPEHPELTSCFVHEPWLLRPEEREGDDEDESDFDRTGTLDSRPDTARSSVAS